MQQVLEETIDYLPKDQKQLILELRAELLWYKDQVVDARQKELRLLQIIETLSTLIAGPRPEQGRSDAAAPANAPAAPASGALYKTRSSKSA